MRKLVLALLFLAQPALAQTAPVTSRVELARRFAPVFRFNAYVKDDSSPMNKAEELFPMSVARFFDELAEGRTRVVVKDARDSDPGANEERTIRSTVAIEPGRIRGVPRHMAGDAPGTAPLYFHAYAKERQTFVEYWVFYPMDRCRVKVLGLTVPLGGHRGDWEGITVVLDEEGLS